MSPKTNPRALANAKSYVQANREKYGLDPFDERPSELTVSPELGQRVGRVYQRLPHNPNHPKVKASYEQFKRETLAQYLHLKALGVHFEPWLKPGQPYTNSQEMREDVAKNGHLFYFPTINEHEESFSGPKDNPLLERTGEVAHGYNQTYNDLFRAVHDYFGHAVHGHQFGPQGELRAWVEHAKMFSPLARPALSMETHGQNSWVNFGPHKPQGLPASQRPYAEQKTNVLPEKLYPTKLARRPKGGIYDWRESLDQAGRTPKGGWSSAQYHRNKVHDIFADYLEDNNDPRAAIVRNRMTPRAAYLKATTTDSGHNRTNLTTKMVRRYTRGRFGDRNEYNFWRHVPDPVVHRFADGTKLAVMVHRDQPYTDDVEQRIFHVAWDGPAKRWYNTVMTPEQFHQWRESFPEPERTQLELTYNNNSHTQTHDSEEDTRQKQEEYEQRQQNMSHLKGKLARKTPHRIDSPAAALHNSYTVNAQKRREIAEQIIKEAGLHPAAVRTVLAHEQGKGVRSTVLTAIQRRMDPGLAKYVAAWFGLLSREKALTVFTPHDAGHDRLHILASKLPVDEMGSYLGQAGIPKYSVEENGNGSRAFVFSPNGEYDPHVARVSGGLDASLTTYPGTGFKLGSDSGSDANSRAKFRDAITDFERSNTSASTGPTS